MLALLQEVAHCPDVKIDWNTLVKNTSTGISDAREYQMLWHHLAYRHALLDKLEYGASPLVSMLLLIKFHIHILTTLFTFCMSVFEC